jgi:hypothetical protein
MSSIHTSITILAQADLQSLADSGTSQIMIFALVVCVGGIVASGFQLMRGEILHAVYILIGALVIGGAVPIAKAFFTFSGAN